MEPGSEGDQVAMTDSEKERQETLKRLDQDGRLRAAREAFEQMRQGIEWQPDEMMQDAPGVEGLGQQAPHPNQDDLIRRLEEATEGSRELNRLIAEHVHGKPRPPLIMGYVPDYTESLDVALTLVPEGWVWSMSTYGRSGGFAAVAPKGWREWEAAEDQGGVEVYGNSPALALAIASLKARARHQERE
jgi:hypothetical protein